MKPKNLKWRVFFRYFEIRYGEFWLYYYILLLQLSPLLTCAKMVVFYVFSTWFSPALLDRRDRRVLPQPVASRVHRLYGRVRANFCDTMCYRDTFIK